MRNYSPAEQAKLRIIERQTSELERLESKIQSLNERRNKLVKHGPAFRKYTVRLNAYRAGVERLAFAIIRRQASLDERNKVK